jgi:hypothetical protein
MWSGRGAQLCFATRISSVSETGGGDGGEVTSFVRKRRLVAYVVLRPVYLALRDADVKFDGRWEMRIDTTGFAVE